MVERQILLNEILNQYQYIDAHPEVAERMSQFGLSKHSLYTTDLLFESGKISVIEAIYFIENPLNYT